MKCYALAATHHAIFLEPTVRLVTNYPWYRHERSLGKRTGADRPLLRWRERLPAADRANAFGLVTKYSQPILDHVEEYAIAVG
jgi:hypothetical protein